MRNFVDVDSSLTTTDRVASLPVPAVVLTAMSGGVGLGTPS